MQGDDPPYLPVGTDVSAKYKGAFCEAKVKKVVRNIKCKVTLKAGGIATFNDDVIKGTLRVGSTVEIKQDPKKDPIEAVITKIQDCSQYTVVFDDGDITTLRRSALCLKSGRHFNESETLDQLPLTHPEHFSTPVIAGRRGRRGRAQSDESEGEGSSRRTKADSAEREPHVGKVVLVESASGAERRRPHQPAFPALVVAPTAQIKVKEDYLVRSFKDGRYYTVPKKEAREFRKGGAPPEWSGVEAALQYLDDGVLPPHWDRDSLFDERRNSSDDSSDDEPREEKDHFVAQLYKFMDDRGTPLNRNPTIANRDIDLYRLFRVVQKVGGYNRVTNQNQWKTIADKMGFLPVTPSITNLCKQAYKKFLHSFEDFYRKLGVTLVAHPRGARTPPAGRSLIRDRDKQPPAAASASAAPATPTPTASSAASTPTSVSCASTRGRDKDSDKSETEKSEKEEKIEKSRASDEDDSADNQPLAPRCATPKSEKEKEKEKDKSWPASEERVPVKSRSLSKTRSLPPAKSESHEKRLPKRRPLSSKLNEGGGSISRGSRRPHVSTDSDSSGRASRCGLGKKTPSRRSQSANSASSGNTVASDGGKRPRKRKSTEPSAREPVGRSGISNVKAQVGDRLKVYYGPAQSESKVTYEAKVIEVSRGGLLRVHYTGWNTRYDEWIKPQRIALNVSRLEAEKGTSVGRRARSKRPEGPAAEVSGEAGRSDSDSDSDTDADSKGPAKKPDGKTSPKTPTQSKEAKAGGDCSGKPRKRPGRAVSTPSASSPPKRSRLDAPHSSQGRQGRDYDLNEIRSELKGLQTVKQEPEEAIDGEPVPADPSDADPAAAPTTSAEGPRSDGQTEDVYEFKEPEPFELELHDEKKKRTHRIFDDISPTKYASTLSKSLSEEISEDPSRPRPAFGSPSPSSFGEFAPARDAPERRSPEGDSKDGSFSLDDDSLPGEGSSGPVFEGFTPAKNQETYSKKNKVPKMREMVDDSPESPADDERSSDDEREVTVKEEECSLGPTISTPVIKKMAESVEGELERSEEVKDAITLLEELPPLESIPMPPDTPPPQIEIQIPGASPNEDVEPTEDTKDEKITAEEVNLSSIPLPEAEPRTPPRLKIEKLDPDPAPAELDAPSSPIDTEEDKSEPDSPARIDVLPEPPPGFLLQSEGPKIAEKLLKAINSAKRLSTSPPPAEARPAAPERDGPSVKKLDGDESPVLVEPRPLAPKLETLKPPARLEVAKRSSPAETKDSIFGEPADASDARREAADIKKVKPKESPLSPPSLPSLPSLQNPPSALERRKSVADLPLGPGKNNKVLSDTIQKLSSQINQSASAVAPPPQPFRAEDDGSDSSDSDDSDRRLIIDRAADERAGPHAGKSAGEWSAGQTLLMLEDACKNQRKHGANVVVAGGGRGAAPEDDGSLSLLLCEETIPGSPAPDAEPAPSRTPAPHTPFACAPQHHHRDAPGGPGVFAGAARVASGDRRRDSGEARRAEVDAARDEDRGDAWPRRHALIDNTPPTTPDSSLDLSPPRERRTSERDSPAERKDEEEEGRAPPDGDGPTGECPRFDATERTNRIYRDVSAASGRARLTSESSSGGRGRGRRPRRDTDDHHPLKYNFYVDLDPAWDSRSRIKLLTTRMSDLRKAYHSVKAELAAIDRRRKKLRRKEREAVKAAKAACS
ncbi:AT-rich interactive domain-containing protein 4B isoform X2 [Pieris napi]|uniref:AT-rich interactive domain-containing protein 4B isoform X2 n=1 Tax=Pieris napi TaxID=78633 RepID=UPI001FBB4283|nr:AT-rich interactive domain-containing protein 4B isoform X2 [Pieris napi]